MFCKNCGTQMADDAKFCPVCGTPAKQINPAASGGCPDDSGQPAPQTEGAGSSLTERFKSRSFLAWIGLAVVIIVVVLLIILGAVNRGSGGSGRSYERVVSKYIKAIENNDAEAVLDCFPEEVVNAYRADNGYTKKDVIDRIQTRYLDPMLEVLEEDSYYASDWSVSYGIGSVADCVITDFGSSQICSAGSASYTYELADQAKLKEMKYVELDQMEEYTFWGEHDVDTYSIYLWVGKIRSNWYVIDVSGSF